MFSHVMLGANDLDASKAFYDAALGALGTAPGRGDDKGRVLYASGGALFMLTRPIDGNPACHANGGTIGFRAKDTAAIDAWHAAGLAHGGTACEDPPGWRETPFGGLYLAYLRDPAGNKVCAAFREPR
ncbi:MULTISPECIES: VOC family protein [unclassified Sphingomonas]|jgi:catechol 2,3-dioxygenase-like lactoylglutathione lyase family enzyme|uniref:VOC family protein n=1 Tax=unclassified Sphingomonas TaxID=196159 RepID=UPI000E1044C8|nr:MULTISPECIES: VOC family protein [unclassified Sphingomonas]AXJ96559.1 VOC family protein [Sphingomonas sp. FARSPH]